MVGSKIKEWKGFPKRLFLTNNYDAHKHLYDSMRNRHISLLKAEKKKIDDEQEIIRIQELQQKKKEAEEEQNRQKQQEIQQPKIDLA